MEETSSFAAVIEPMQGGGTRTNDSTVSDLLMVHDPEHVTALCGASLGSLCGTTSELQQVFVTVEHQKRIFGAETWVELDPRTRVQQGRQGELDNIERFGVRTVITLCEAKQRGLKLVCAKWLDESKTVSGDPTAVRSSLVATEINSYAREDVSQSTFPIKCFTLILSLASSRTDPSGQHNRPVARYDVRVAFLHDLAFGKIAVNPPKGLVESVCCWFLQKATYGTKAASE